MKRATELNATSALIHAPSQPPWMHLRERPDYSFRAVDLNTAGRSELQEMGMSAAGALRVLKLRQQRTLLHAHDAATSARLSPADARSLAEKAFGQLRNEVVLAEVQVEGGNAFSGRAWALNIKFLTVPGAPVVVAAAEVYWRGVPFVVEQLVSEDENASGSMTFRFGEDHALPPGPIEVHLSMVDSSGGAARQKLAVWVLPSNPFSMFLSAGSRSIFNGSVRPDWSAPNWLTQVRFTFVNGDAVNVTMRRRVEWSFWDGGVGSGSRVESGSFDWPSTITVPRFGNFSAGITFTSPPGSGVHGKYEGKEDMALELVFFKSDGTRVRAEITCRIMAGWGLNIIQVGNYTPTEQAAIQTGINDARAVYENHGLTFSSEEWWSISNAQAGGYVMLADEDEWEDLLDDWTVPNNSVDVFVVRTMWSTVAGLSPVPGPAGKDGSCEDDGLSVTMGLGCLAHELGHYMGGHDHADALGRGNVMHSICGGRSFTYNQYRGFLGHGFTRIVR
jgi:hypothetical protein